MGCNCGKKLPKAPRQARPFVAPPPPTVTVYRNASQEAVVARNPRLNIQPGETIDLSSVEINSYVVKMAIRNGELVAVEDTAEAADPPAAKTAAPKTAAPKGAKAKAVAAAASA